ncbi:serine/threonine-protein kinase [Blastopirellula marina]|uniref:Serine/threonine-protein kinase n=1 Tax=Blastopirellula marina DSM 3645 TaxID=314230 RepID=A3ZZC2_9BACT|nr:serine/threonine-protein kinase [Blastopirellula marina]EAQ78080.1 serine/threonine-protein kinase [Blastopirellula marina DSM 3645]
MAIDQEKSIFFEALDIDSSSERDAYVEQACEGDANLHVAVVKLLREHERLNNPIDQPLVAGSLSTAPFEERASPSPIRHSLGAMIGPYMLMEQIGEGGFGLVFVANQQSPVRRQVALKIIKPGLESQEVLARFAAERQALAMMDHENIARVFDAGVTDSGQPYFAMELVRGVPLIEFCDNHKLDVYERLQLFISICNAVQHAHQKGIIHRDLKPTNVLVTLQDGRPVPKVIDFGIAKAIGYKLTDNTIYTRFAAMMGTPAYMSPEQAEMSNVDVDTRSDIYSLGVLLYELLTGSTPFTTARLNSVGFDELRRIIREEDPLRPSMRFSTLRSDLATTVSDNRRLEPTTLRSFMKGDLDWIVIKSLDKDRNRRYPSAAALSEDVSRFLHQQPVEARPPSTFYRFSKFARRNKVILSTASLIAAALILGTGVSIWQARVAFDALHRARDAEGKANQAREDLEDFTEKLKQANVLLASGRAYADTGDWSNAHQAYVEAVRLQPRYFYVWMERGALYARLGLWEMAGDDYSKALDLGCPVDGIEFLGVPQLFFYSGDLEAFRQISGAIKKSNNGSVDTKMRSQLVGDLPAEAAAQIAAAADQLIEDRLSPQPGPRRSITRMPLGAMLYIAGWAHLRAGHHDLAIDRLERSYSDTPNWGGRGISFPLLAIAYDQAGRSEDARQAFEQSEILLDAWLKESNEHLHGAPPMPWFDWIEYLMHHREASQLLTGESPNIAAQLAEQKMRAKGAIE